MRSAITKACTLLDVQALVSDLEDDSCVDGEEAVGANKGTAGRLWFHRFCSLKEYLTPSIALPFRDNFLGFLGRRVRRLGLSDAQNRILLSWGTDFCMALNVYRHADPEVLVQVRDRDETIGPHEHKEPRHQ